MHFLQRGAASVNVRVSSNAASASPVPLYVSNTKRTRNSSGDEIANVNFLYDDIVHALKIQ